MNTHTDGKTAPLDSSSGDCGLHLIVRETILRSFSSLLQQGVGVRAGTGISVKVFLCDVLHLSPSYLETRIQTIFLDGKAVDDLDSALIRDGSVLALSAAMPGLLGATLRRGSHYAAMRSEISYRSREEGLSSAEGMVFVKLFNLLVDEVGPSLLSKGIWIRGTDLRDFLQRQPSRFWSACVKSTWDGQDMNPNALPLADWPPEPLLLTVTGWRR